MKNRIAKIAASFLVAVTLFSCGSSRFTRSQYGHRDWSRGGYEAVEQTGMEQSSSSRKNDQKPAEAAAEKKEIPTVENVELIPAAQTEKSVVPATKKGNNNENYVDAPAAITETTTETVATEAEKAEAEKNNDATNGADTNTILLVILALFIPPLAVFLKDGSVSTMFWITLILCIIGGGFLWGWGGYFGLGYLIAIILAILYVLDMI
ncbi:MAG TPA: YqaE/Pmp3 family membrane protein [Flavobacteriales bacterium]|nr:YqaE/Pmp3 family membrane protein [Flavobacteriales bacterium]HRE95644.1 YqaE/Pmp3 family membrane protein [Flavobacteriales bacterium]HRJ34533.1 YqaE/Pmp3 family membrane protein [Flavobacteriales bacterium]HRJ37555.1 YqaE/Pmp3 family membrane protein [Flavobacteriales bacterium]